MNPLLLIFALLLLLAEVCVALPKAACVYSSSSNYAYKNDQTQILASLGWGEDLYENTRIKQLVGNLQSYDMVIMNALYNYENYQNLSQYGDDFRKYLLNGGCLFITDANYSMQAEWLSSIDPNLIWIPSNEPLNAEGKQVIQIEPKYALLANENDPGSAWSYPKTTSPYMTVLYKNVNGTPAVCLAEIGKGVVVVTSLYHQTGWPTAGFLKNLIKWIRDPDRLSHLKDRDIKYQEQLSHLPILNVPMLATAVTDGIIESGEWDGAADIPVFYDMHGRNDVIQATKCKIGRTENDLVVLFSCSDDSIDKLAKSVSVRDGRVWENDSVEIFLDPTGTRKTYYHFAVSCSGVQYDAIGRNPSFDTYWKAKTSINDNGWTAEIRIPIASLGKDAIKSDGNWAANFNRTTHPDNTREYSGWSITTSGFHQPERFGTITGMSFRPCNYPLVSRIEVNRPERWYLGANDIKLHIFNESSSSSNAVLHLIDLVSGNTLWSKDISLKKASTVPVKCRQNLETEDSRLLQFVLSRDRDCRHIIASSVVLTAVPSPLLDISVVYPIVRGSIQSQDRIKKLVVDGNVGYNSEDTLYLECEGVDSVGNKKINVVRKVYSRKGFRVAFDLRTLPVGKYQFSFRLLKKDLELASQIIPLTVAPAAKTEVSFDDKRVCRVNGKPFFPIGLYHVAPAAINAINDRSRSRGLPELDLYKVIRQVKDLGFNTIYHTWGMPDESYLDYSQSLGLWVMPEVASPSQEQVALANRYTNVLMWYGSDEPSGETLNLIKHARVQTAQLDPNRPVSSAVCNPDLFRSALGGFDFVMLDPYTIRFAPLSRISDWMKKAMDAGNGTKPIWLVPQAFTNDSPGCKEPTPEELKCQAYIGLVHGATGLIWYGFWTPEYWSDGHVDRGYWVLSESKLWDAFPKLNAEVSTLAPIILTGKSYGPVKCSSPDIHTCLWKYRGKSYLLTVNTLYTPVDCTIEGFGDNAEVLFENKKVITRGGSLRQKYKPLEVHVYKF